MNRRSLARLVAALGMAAAVAIGTAGPAAALPPPGADDRGAVDEREQPGPVTGEPDPDPTAEDPGPTAEDPVPAAENPGPEPTVEDPGPATENPDPAVENPGPATGNPDPRVTNPGVPVPGVTDPHAAAPTVNLNRLANAIVVKQQGIYLHVTAPAGLNVGPIEISVGFGPERFTRNYDNATGFDRILAYQPLDGAARKEYYDISLLERGVPGGPFNYSISKQVDVVPRYTVTTSPLIFATGGCDPLNGEADPTIAWVDPTGVQHREDYGGVTSGGGDEVTVSSNFAGKRTDVDVNSGLTMPTIEWVDRDPGGFAPVGENALPRGPRLLPFPESYRDRNPVVQEITDSLPDAGGDCTAQIRYTITYTPTAYVP